MSSDQTGSRVAAVTACYIVPIPLEILATSLRVYARQRQSRAGLDKFALDDFFIIFATVRDPTIQKSFSPYGETMANIALQVCAVGQCCVGLAYG